MKIKLRREEEVLGTKGDYSNPGVEVGLLAVVILMGERFLR